MCFTTIEANMRNHRFDKNDKKDIITNLLSQNKTTKEIMKLTGYPESVVRYYREPARHTKCSEISQRISEQRRKVKKKLIDYSGGKCVKCGYDKCNGALAFHHVQPSEKEFQVSNGKTVGFEKNKSEVDKCLLLCHNCHSEFHGGLWEISNDMANKQNEVRSQYVDKPLIFYKD